VLDREKDGFINKEIEHDSVAIGAQKSEHRIPEGTFQPIHMLVGIVALQARNGRASQVSVS
jgi:hypothetical protein